MSTAQEIKTRAVNLTDEEIDAIRASIGAAACEFGPDPLELGIEKLSASRDAVWQSEPPTEDGAYWWWEHETHEPRIVHVVKTPDPTIRAVRSGTWVLFLLPKWNRGQWWPIPIVMPPI